MEGVEDLKKGMIEELNKKRPRGQNTQSRKVDMMAMMRRGQQNNSKSMKAATSGTSLNGGAKNVGLKVTYKGPAEDKSKRKCTLSFHHCCLRFRSNSSQIVICMRRFRNVAKVCLHLTSGTITSSHFT